jgi:PIN domain nuclease of toxin-antitoxin system
MRLLLDTHAFNWWDSDPAQLSARALAMCQDRDNELLVSVASAWEMQIKTQLGKLTLAVPLANIFANQQLTNQVEILPVTLAHVMALDALPQHHRDPFDRLLVAQATVEQASLVTRDQSLAPYPVTIIW